MNVRQPWVASSGWCTELSLDCARTTKAQTHSSWRTKDAALLGSYSLPTTHKRTYLTMEPYSSGSSPNRRERRPDASCSQLISRGNIHTPFERPSYRPLTTARLLHNRILASRRPLPRRSCWRFRCAPLALPKSSQSRFFRPSLAHKSQFSGLYHRCP